MKRKPVLLGQTVILRSERITRLRRFLANVLFTKQARMVVMDKIAQDSTVRHGDCEVVHL